MNESSLLINSAFALRQDEHKPVFTHIGKPIEKPYTDSEIQDLKAQMIRIYSRDLNQAAIDKRIKFFEERWRGKTHKTDGKTNYPIDLQKLERIIITPKASGYISTAFIDFIKSHNIAIYWINGSGKIEASFMPFNFKNPSLIVNQVKARDNGKALEISKYLIKLKLESQGMQGHLLRLEMARDIKEIMQVEALAANLYFKQWNFHKMWNWKGRHGKNSNKSSVDQVNTLLNLGYGLLAQRMSEILLKRGFELSIGFLHINDDKAYWNMLTYDFIEPFRVWIDLKVLQMINGLRIKPDDFTFTEDKTSMIIHDKAFNSVLEELLYVLNPLEYKSLPLIRTIEKMLIS